MIKRLKREVYELIAAGEVIERPASIVKELIENSIDAGARCIDVEIKGGGKRLIKVVDNGSGIKREDLKNAFLSHSTSKISSASDLDKITTLGFRGEALASIAAVSKITVITKTKEDETGSEYKIEGGLEGEVKSCGFSDGTAVMVEDLFYNTPARLKFLKRDHVEAGHIEDIVTKLCISRKDISFSLKKDAKVVFKSPGNNKLKDAVYSVYGSDFTESLMKIDYKLNDMRVYGYVTKPMNARTNRKLQIFFVNNRFVKSKLLSDALEEGFKGSVMVSKFPGCVLFIDISADKLDINVHPSKTEVKFSDEHEVVEAVYQSAKKAIAQYNLLPKPTGADKTEKSSFYFGPREGKPQTAEFPSNPVRLRNFGGASMLKEDTVKYVPKRFFKGTAGGVGLKDDKTAFKPRYNKENKDRFDDFIIREEPVKDDGLGEDEQQVIKKRITPNSLKEEAFKNTGSAEKEDDKREVSCKTDYGIRVIGELFKTYILAQVGDYFAVVDKHAAHEKILYIKLSNEEPKVMQGQVLLQPAHITVTPKEKDTVLQNLDIFNKFGFMVEDFGQGSLIIREIPTILKYKDYKGAFLEILDNIDAKAKNVSSGIMDRIYHTMACRAAVKAGDNTSPEELKALFMEVYKNNDIRNCPHGRPVILTFSKQDLEKRFGREQ